MKKPEVENLKSDSLNNCNAFCTTQHTVGPMGPMYNAKKIAKFRQDQELKARVWPQALCSTDKLNKISTASQMGFQNNLRTRNSKAKIETLIFGHFKNVI